MHTQKKIANKNTAKRKGQQRSEIARELGITGREFQTLKFFLEKNLNPKPFFRQLEEKKNRFKWLEKQAEKHKVRVKIIYDLEVNYGMSFEKSVARLSKPWNDQHKNYLERAKELYNKEGTKTRVETFVLLSYIWDSRRFSRGDIFNFLVKEIAPQLKLREVGPRAIFTIGAKIPKLKDYLGLNDLAIYETMGAYPQGTGILTPISYPYSCCVSFTKKISPCVICQASVIENPNNNEGEDWLVFRI